MIKPPRIRQRPCATAEATRPSSLHHNLRLVTVYKPIGEIKPPRRALRKHGKRQIAALKASVSEFGFLKPILLNPERQIVAGYGAWLAAKELGMGEVPTISIEHLSSEQLRLYTIADNQIPTLETFDDEALRLELGELAELSLTLDLNLELTAIPTSQIDGIPATPAPDGEGGDEDDLPEVPAEPVTRPGDHWQCGDHRLLCGNALEAESYERLLGEERAQLVVSDCPYNVPVNGHVSGISRFDEFAMASGEISADEFTAYLAAVFALLALYSVDGSIHYQFMDWRHMGEMLAAGRRGGHGFKPEEVHGRPCWSGVRPLGLSDGRGCHSASLAEQAARSLISASRRQPRRKRHFGFMD